MKKTLLLGIILLASMTTFSKNSKVVKNDYSKNFLQENQIENVDCTITLSGNISIGGSGITISCAVTESDCQKAGEKAAACLNATKNMVKKMLK